MRDLILFIMLAFPLVRTAAQDLEKIDALLMNTDQREAIQSIDTALNASRDSYTTGLLLNKKAEALIRESKFDEAAALLHQIALSNDAATDLAAVTATTFGLLYLFQGKYDLAFDNLQHATRQFELNKKSNTLEAARALGYLGNLYYTWGQYTQAEEYLTLALAIRNAQLSEHHELIAASYNDLGLVYSASDQDKALAYYEKARSIYEKNHGLKHPKIAITDTNIGQLNQQLEFYGDALNNYESALNIWNTVYTSAHPTKAFVLFSLGLVHAQLNNAGTAREYYEQALQMYHSAYGDKHPDIARTLNALGNLDLHDHHYDKALIQFHNAVQANIPELNEGDPYVNPSGVSYYDGNVLLHSLTNKAEALEARHFGKSLKFKDLADALETLSQCDTLIEKLRQQITRESDKIQLGDIANEVYADGVRIAVEASEVAFHKKAYKELAFYFSERSKAAVLLQAISESNAKSFAGIPSKLLEEERDLKEELALCARALAQKPTPDEERYLRKISFRLNRSYESFTRKLETEFPEYFDLKFNTRTPSIIEIQAKLDDATALLSYFLDERNHRLYIFTITKDHYHIRHTPVPETFDKLITGLRNGIYFNDLSTYVNTSRQLSRLLVPKNLPASVIQLTIVPDAKLSTIPFETLLTGDVQDDDDFSTLPYLLKRYSTGYYFSSSLLLSEKQSLPRAPSILLCAPIEFPDKDNLENLPGTADEVRDIARLFEEKAFKQTVFTHAYANENLVKSGKMKDYDLLHFATHGIVDETHPELSRIFLQTENEASEDGNLFSSEIYNLQLDANLVTLSACQTGLGKISRGEGVIGLSRALVYAGADNCIVSLWSVADESTAVLMGSFYREMLTGPFNSFGAHLRAAKLELMKEVKFASPFYWAPFILIGN